MELTKKKIQINIIKKKNGEKMDQRLKCTIEKTGKDFGKIGFVSSLILLAMGVILLTRN